MGTGFLDGFHTVVTSAYFKPMMPSDLPHLIPWSWFASRQFLSVLMALSWIAWLREEKLGEAGRMPEKTVYIGTAVFTLASFLFFVFASLPRAYYPEIFFHRPEEFAPALFLLVALIGYIRKGQWRTDPFEHWLVLSLIVGFVGQAVFMSHSGVLFDCEFDVAHTLKKVSFICVLTGLLISMYVSFTREVETALELADSEERIRAVVENIVDGIITIDSKGTVQTFNRAAEHIFGYGVDEVIGRNVKCLMPEPYHSEHHGYLEHFSQTGEAQIIGIGREVIGLRRDGSTFPMELAVNDMKVGDTTMFTGIIRDITDRKQMEQMKNEFISTVSHELRTPLTSIKGSLGLVRAGAVGDLPDKLKTMVEIAFNNSDRLVRLINDILDVEKIEAGKMNFRTRPLDLVQLADQAIEANRGYAEEHGVTFAFTNRIAAAAVEADSDRLMQVFSNLLSNAVKFSPKGGQVGIAVSEQVGGFRVSVTDHGDGIPKEFQARIFEKFSQAESSDARRKGGTGLGLSITKVIVEKHGGSVGFETDVGKGTTFFFNLPGREQVASEGIYIPEAISANRILICEDEPDIAKLLLLMLQHGGFGADIAYDADQAKKMLEATDYVAMTLDLKLPGQNGISLIRELRASPETEKTADHRGFRDSVGRQGGVQR